MFTQILLQVIGGFVVRRGQIERKIKPDDQVLRAYAI